MQYRTPEEVYALVINSTSQAEMAPFLEDLRSAGAFSHTLAGLIDHLQADESFRRRVLSDRSIDLAQEFRLRAPEIFALIIAATLLDPSGDFPSEPLALHVSPSPDSLADRFRDEPIDFSTVRQDLVDLWLSRILKSREAAEEITKSPCLALGGDDISRSEFVLLYLVAATVAGKNKLFRRSVGVSTEFLTASGLTESDAEGLVKAIWQMMK
jgi:hypothetical protein